MRCSIRTRAADAECWRSRSSTGMSCVAHAQTNRCPVHCRSEKKTRGPLRLSFAEPHRSKKATHLARLYTLATNPRPACFPARRNRISCRCVDETVVGSDDGRRSQWDLHIDPGRARRRLVTHSASTGDIATGFTVRSCAPHKAAHGQPFQSDVGIWTIA